MGFIHRVTGALRSGRDGHRDPAATPASARWQQRVMITNVERDLEETANEQAYVEAEIAQSREHATRLLSEATAAAADGCAEAARELHEELNQTVAFLAELAEVHQAVATERNRLTRRRDHLAEHLAEYDKLAAAAAAADGPARPDDEF